MRLIRALRDCKQRSFLTVSERAPTVSNKASPPKIGSHRKTIAKIVNYYAVVFLLRPPCLLRRRPFFERKNACNSQETGVCTRCAAIVNHSAIVNSLRVVNLLRVIFLVRRAPLGTFEATWKISDFRLSFSKKLAATASGKSHCSSFRSSAPQPPRSTNGQPRPGNFVYVFSSSPQGSESVSVFFLKTSRR